MAVHLGASAEATFAVNDRGVIVAWNAAAEALLGYTAQQAIGAQCHELMHGVKPSGAPLCSAECPVVEFCKHGASARRFEMLVPRAGGGEVFVDVVTITVYEDNEPIAIHVLNEAPSQRVMEIMARQVERRMPLHSVHGNGHANGHAGAAQFESLTPRELTVLALLAEGVRTEDMAQQLSLSRATVRNHVQNIIVKLGVHSRVEAVVMAIQRGLVATP